jgi:hypothetical protein
VFRIRIRIKSIRSVDQESGSLRAKMTHENRKKFINFMFLSAGCSLLRAEGFSCSLDVLYGGLAIINYNVWIRVGTGIYLKWWNGSRYGFNKSGSATLLKTVVFVCEGYPQLLSIPRYSQISRLDYSRYLTNAQEKPALGSKIQNRYTFFNWKDDSLYFVRHRPKR